MLLYCKIDPLFFLEQIEKDFIYDLSTYFSSVDYMPSRKLGWITQDDRFWANSSPGTDKRLLLKWEVNTEVDC